MTRPINDEQTKAPAHESWIRCLSPAAVISRMNRRWWRWRGSGDVLGHGVALAE